MIVACGRLHLAAWLGGALRCAPFFCALLLAAAQATAQTGAQADWSDADIRASRHETPSCSSSNSTTPLATTDLVLALRDSGRDLLLLDTRTLATLTRCRLPQAMQGAPLRSADGRYIYLRTAQAWVLRLDLQALGRVLALRTGRELSALALSDDGLWLLAGHTQPRSLVLLDAQLQVQRIYPTQALAGGADSAVTGIWHASARRSFVVAFETLPEFWELSYDPGAEPIFDGLVHDYRMGEAVASSGFLGLRRTPLEQPLLPVLVDPGQRHLLAIAPMRGPKPAGAEGTRLDIVNLDIRRRIRSHTLAAPPLAGAGVAFSTERHAWLVLPTGAPGGVLLMDSSRWHLHETLAALPGVRTVHSARSHPAAPQLWLHATNSAGDDTLVLVDKRDFHVLTTLRKPGHSWTGVSFANQGRVAVLATRGPRSEVLLRDTLTLHELQGRELAHVEAVFALDAPQAVSARP